MRVLICPDKFAGTLTATDAADAMAAGWRDRRPADEVRAIPLADGGPGFLDVVRAACGGEQVDVSTCDPLGRPVTGSLLRVGNRAYLESAQACGSHLLALGERDPKRTSSYGLGLLLTAAVESGATEVVVGLGGSATNDAGAGMLAALDAAPLDLAGYALPYGGAALLGCTSLGGRPRLRSVHLTAATDVDNPLVGVDGATAVFGPQKGATAADVPLLDAALGHFATILEQALPGCPQGLAGLPGAGAAGGLGAAIFACGGRRVSGFGLVRQLTDLDRALERCDLVITGEGRFDAQSLRGKVVAGVAAAARDRGLPCVVIAGQIAVGEDEARAAGVVRSYSLADHYGDLARALAEPGSGLRAVASQIAHDLGA